VHWIASHTITNLGDTPRTTVSEHETVIKLFTHPPATATLQPQPSNDKINQRPHQPSFHTDHHLQKLYLHTEETPVDEIDIQLLLIILTFYLS
jgi:hypothetical protein